ncbi:MAG: TolC family protein [Chlorobium sp.]|nr:TolC family protein [Chlorobium sp.]
MKRLRLLFLLVLMVVMLPALPDSVSGADIAGETKLVLTLDDAVLLGLSKNRTLEISRLDRQMADQKVRETWAEVLPKVSTGFTYTRSLKSSILFFPDVFSGGTGSSFTPLEISADNAASATIDLQQTIFKGTAIAGIRAATIVRKISDEAYRNTQAAVVADIKHSYFDALISRDQLRLIQQSIDRWEEARKDTQAMFRQGVAADIDTLKAFLSVENLRPDLIQAEHRVGYTMTKLKNAMGISQDSEVLLTGKLELSPKAYPDDIVSAYREALELRPDIHQLELQVEAEDAKVFAAKAERFPVITAFGQLGSQTAFNDNSSFGDSAWPVSASVGLQVSLPIFTGFRTSALVEQAKISRLQTRLRLEELKSTARAEVEVRLSGLRESQKRISVQSKTIAVAERSYKISLLRFREGVGSRLELTEAELQLDKAKTNYLQAVYDYLVASVQLDKSLGRNPVPPPGKG